MNGNVIEKDNLAYIKVEPETPSEVIKVTSIIVQDQAKGGKERVDSGIFAMWYVAWPTKALCLAIDKTRIGIGGVI